MRYMGMGMGMGAYPEVGACPGYYGIIMIIIIMIAKNGRFVVTNNFGSPLLGLKTS